jgi:hypothetical protein
MKMIIEIKETPRGDVEFLMQSEDMKTATRKEACYAINLRDLLKREIFIDGVSPMLKKEEGE